MPKSWLSGLKNRFVSTITSKQEKIAEIKSIEKNGDLSIFAGLGAMQNVMSNSSTIKGAINIRRNQRQRRKLNRQMNKH